MIAIEHNEIDISKLLIQHNCKLDIKNKDGYNILNIIERMLSFEEERLVFPEMINSIYNNIIPWIYIYQIYKI